MKNKKNFTILLAVFALLLIGAYVLYHQLSGSMKHDILSQMNHSSTQENAEKNPDSQNNSENNSASQDNTGKDSSSDENSDSDTNENSSDEESLQAPDFTVTDASGNSVHFSDFLGKPIVLNFWASWCGPCKNEMPDFEAAFKEYGEDIHFLMVNLTDGYQETTETAKSFIEASEYTFPVYFDTEKQNAALTYGVYSVPVTYFIDAEGNFIAHAKGALDMETLKKGISMIYDIPF